MSSDGLGNTKRTSYSVKNDNEDNLAWTKKRIEHLRKQVFQLNIEIDKSKLQSQQNKDDFEQSGRMPVMSSHASSETDYSNQEGMYKVKTYRTPNYASDYLSPYAERNMSNYNSGEAYNTVYTGPLSSRLSQRESSSAQGRRGGSTDRGRPSSRGYEPSTGRASSVSSERSWGRSRGSGDPNDLRETDDALLRWRQERARQREEKIRRIAENKQIREQQLSTSVKQMHLSKHETAMQVIKEENEGVKYILAQNEALLKKNQGTRDSIRDSEPRRKAYLQMMADKAEREAREKEFLQVEIARLEGIEKKLKGELKATLKEEEEHDREERAVTEQRRAAQKAKREEEARVRQERERARRQTETAEEEERRRLLAEIDRLVEMERELEEQIRKINEEERKK